MMITQITIALIAATAGGVVAFLVWMRQQLHTRKQVRRVLLHDIQEHRHTFMLMAQFFENLREAIQRKEAKRFHFSRTDFAVYHGLISQIPLLKEHEVDVITSFYETYKVFEGDIISIADTLRQWDDIRIRDEEISDHRMQIALYGLLRIVTLRELLLENTSGDGMSEWSNLYRHPLEKRLAEHKKQVKNEYEIDLL